MDHQLTCYFLDLPVCLYVCTINDFYRIITFVLYIYFVFLHSNSKSNFNFNSKISSTNRRSPITNIKLSTSIPSSQSNTAQHKPNQTKPNLHLTNVHQASQLPPPTSSRSPTDSTTQEMCRYTAEFCKGCDLQVTKLTRLSLCERDDRSHDHVVEIVKQMRPGRCDLCLPEEEK